MTIRENDIVRVRSWSGTFRVSSVMERPPLAYVRQIDGERKGYIQQSSIERISAAKESQSNKQPRENQAMHAETRRVSESESNNQMTLF